MTQVPLRYSFLLATLLTVLLAGTSLLVGADSTATGERLEMIVTTLRIPRMFAALLAGVALGAGGVLLQAATRNPLAETGLLGVNSGAALGVVLGISFAGAESGYEYLIYALGGAMLASAAVLAIASTGRASPLRLILAGVALGATLRGITGYLLLRNTAGFDQYRFWTLGSLSGVDSRMVLHAAPFVASGLLLAGFMVRPLSALALGDEAARALGHHPGRVRVLVAIAVTLLAAASVAIAGPIAFLGLLAPWLARAVAGPFLPAQLFLAAVFGAGLLLLADTIARVIVRPYEVPASVLIAIAGAPLLVWAARSRSLSTLDGAR
ncbi:MAG TPA: ABC transporter permease [Micromonosporaceae bacterium]|nr:ABC transporter permease [Micromonosporaceae bacterium]